MLTALRIQIRLEYSQSPHSTLSANAGRRAGQQGKGIPARSHATSPRSNISFQVANIVAECIAKIARIDYNRDWPDLFTTMFASMQGAMNTLSSNGSDEHARLVLDRTLHYWYEATKSLTGNRLARGKQIIGQVRSTHPLCMSMSNRFGTACGTSLAAPHSAVPYLLRGHMPDVTGQFDCRSASRRSFRGRFDPDFTQDPQQARCLCMGWCWTYQPGTKGCCGTVTIRFLSKHARRLRQIATSAYSCLRPGRALTPLSRESVC